MSYNPGIESVCPIGKEMSTWSALASVDWAWQALEQKDLNRNPARISKRTLNAKLGAISAENLRKAILKTGRQELGQRPIEL
jgi:hypothetical protein